MALTPPATTSSLRCSAFRARDTLVIRVSITASSKPKAMSALISSVSSPSTCSTAVAAAVLRPEKLKS